MKNKLLGFILILFAISIIASNVSTAQPVPEGMEKVHIDIKGMTCSKCQDKVQTALDALPDVRSVVVKWSDGAAELLVNKGSDHKELEEAVKRAGFTVSTVKCACKG